MAFFSEFCAKKTSLPQFIMTKSTYNTNDNPHLGELIMNVQISIKLIRAAICDAYRSDLGGSTGLINFQGEHIKNLDQISNDIFISTFSSSKHICFLISEENEKIVEVSDYAHGKYIICFDPLDGSSNIDCSVSIGTIFGIYHVTKGIKKREILRTLCKENLVAAGYALYGFTTILMLSIGSTVNGFTYSEAIGEFILTHENLRISRCGNTYSINEAFEASWLKGIQVYIKSKKKQSIHNIRYTSRYIGSMVADVHRTLLHGGIFIYPATCSYPQGKLRLLYECVPLAYVINAAGGISSDGEMNILEKIPTEIHQRSPIILGSPEDVNELLSLIKQYNIN